MIESTEEKMTVTLTAFFQESHSYIFFSHFSGAI